METAAHRGSEAANEQSYTTTFLVDRSPEEVYRAINDVRSWWSGRIDGDTDRLGGEFRYRHGELHDSRQRVTELVPGKRVAWRVVEGRLSFVEPQEEWRGTEVVFDIARKGDRTEVRFRHLGLTRACACYDACSSGWDAFVNGNLRRWIATGEVQPDPFEG